MQLPDTKFNTIAGSLLLAAFTLGTLATWIYTGAGL